MQLIDYEHRTFRDVDLVINLDTFKRSALFPGPFWAKAVKRLERLKKEKKVI